MDNLDYWHSWYFSKAYDFNGEYSNYYSILEVGRHCSTLEVRKAYKKMSKVYHPDKSPDTVSQDKFHRIKNAYDVIYYFRSFIERNYDSSTNFVYRLLWMILRERYTTVLGVAI